jgi:molybdate transport system permease protein
MFHGLSLRSDMSHIDLQPLWLTLRLGLTTTVVLFVACLPLAWWLSNGQTRWRHPVRAFTNMPLVLPPSVLGFYLLLAFSPAYPFGHFLEHAFNVRLVFSFGGILIGSIIFSLPFMINPLVSGFESLPSSLSEAAKVLGKSRLTTLFRVLLPNMKPALMTGIVMSFAHTIGEFGVVLMIGGKIPGVTKVASIAIYDEVEALNYHAANVYAGVLFVACFVVVTTMFIINRRSFKLV